MHAHGAVQCRSAFLLSGRDYWLAEIKNGLDRFLQPEVYRLYQVYRRRQWLSTGELQALQQAKWARLLDHIGKNVPYYARILGGDAAEPASLGAFPVLTRERVLDNFQQLISTAHRPSDMHLRKSGGSTGHPLELYLDNRLKTINRALERLGDYEWVQMPYRARRVVLWGLNQNEKGDGWKERLAFELKGALQHRWKYYVTYADEATMGGYVHQLQRIRPQILFGYVSAVKKLAEYVDKHGVTGLRPEVVMTTSETLTEEDRAYLQEVLQARVVNRYAAAEVGLIASECPAGKLHIHSHRLIVEALKDGRPVPPGEPGELVITDLDNYAFPLVRYAIGDVGILSSERCRCGRSLPVLEQVLGRTHEVVRTAAGDEIAATALIRAVRRANGRNQIRQVQFLQDCTERLVVRIIRGESYSDQTEASIRDGLQRRFFAQCAMRIEFEYVDEIAPAASGKVKTFVSCLQD